MKKALLVIVCAAGAIVSNAQVNFGITGGVNFATIGQNFEDADDEEDAKMRLAPRIGVVADFTLSEALSFRPGLAYASKGYKSEDTGSEGDYSWEDKSTAIVNYLEIPLNVVYKTGNFEIIAGPYLAFGLGGKFKYEGTETFMGETESWDEEVDFGFTNEISESQEDDDKAYTKGMDFGLTIGAGYNVGPGVISLSYSKGLTNLTPKYADSDFDPADYKTTNTVINLSFTYFLKK